MVQAKSLTYGNTNGDMSMKIAYAVLIVIHGLIHLLGFVKAFGLGEISQLTAPISRPVGALWLLSTLLLLAYASMFLFGFRYGWLVGAAAVVLSQVLIIMYWNDAKFGTIPNIVILLVVLVSYGHYAFNRMVDDDLVQLRHDSSANVLVISNQDTENLPLPVRKWLQRSGAIGFEFSSVGSIRQFAEMKLSPEQQNWYRAEALQFTRVDKPGFVWSVEVAMNPFVHFVGRDKLENGKGNMLIKANGLVPLVNATGPKLDEGTIQRYLGEMVWFPAVAISPFVTWEVIDENTARATIEYMGTIGSGVFYFDDTGDFMRFSAMRYQGNEPESERHEWVLEVDEYATLDGIRIPSSMTATWKLPEGDWTWLHLKVIEHQVN